jgi:hypothetical protein
LFDQLASPKKVEQHSTTKFVQFDLNINNNSDSNTSNIEQTESIWSTLQNYPTNDTNIEKKSETNNRCIQQSQENVFNLFSPKRQYSVSNLNESSETNSAFPKRKKMLPSPKIENSLKRSAHVTKIGGISLSWPQYKISSCMYMKKRYTVTNTCSIDAALFVFYHCYKTGSSAFRQLFETDITPCHTALRKVFELVDSDGWDIARLHWLISHNLLNKMTRDGVFDIEDTIYENALQFVRPMQMYNIKSECSCVMCPKRFQLNKSIDISLS